MSTTGYRIQEADRNVSDLLDPAEQYSHAWNGDESLTRHGVSVCDTLEDLATYLATDGQGIGYGVGEWVIVHLAGEWSDDEPVDAAAGERLVLPTEILSVEPMGEEFFEMIGAAYDRVYAA